MTESRLSWTGWLRVPPAGWSRACVAPTWGACWRLLLACLADAPPSDAPVGCALSVEALVNDGRHPEHRRKPR